jgi:hypothetical protein
MNDNGAEPALFIRIIKSNFNMTIDPTTPLTPVILGRSQRSGNEFEIIEETKRDEIISYRSPKSR